MRKFLNKKNILILLLLIFAFFTVFKYFKGKSFFDTIVEYSNNIHSQNSVVSDADKENYIRKSLVYMPIKYTDYGEFSNQKHIVTTEGSNNIYIYDANKDEEILFQEINENSKLQDIIINGSWVIWVENTVLNTKDNISSYEWKIYGKSLKGTEKFLIDSAQYKSDSNGIVDDRVLYPDEFDIDADTFVYRKYVKNTEQNGNIISDKTVNGIVTCNLRENKIYMISNSSDLNKEILYSPKVYGNKIVWVKGILNHEDNTIMSSEVYTYNISDGSTKKIYDTSKIKYIDINGENIAIVLSNPDDNIIILNLNTGIQTNILYKGSRVEKYINNDNSETEITGINFVTSNNILIDFGTVNEKLSALVYNIKTDEFYNLNNDVKLDAENHDGISYYADNYKIKTYVGIAAKNISENPDDKHVYQTINEIDIYNENQEILEEYKDNVYYKYYNYEMR